MPRPLSLFVITVFFAASVVMADEASTPEKPEAKKAADAGGCSVGSISIGRSPCRFTRCQHIPIRPANRTPRMRYIVSIRNATTRAALVRSHSGDLSRTTKVPNRHHCLGHWSPV